MKIRIAALALAITLAIAAFVTAFASSADLGKNWRVYNVKPATSSYWDINQTQTASGGGLQFPIQQFDTKTSGSFAVSLLNNYNFDMTGKTITATMSWTAGEYETRSDPDCGGTSAYVRLEFQDTTSGAYDSNDYWWSTGVNSLDLSVISGGQLTISLNDRALWSNQSGKLATDTTQDWQQWQGDIVHMSPYDGFTRAVKDVKQVGLAFGSQCRYASGVARVGGAGTFTVSDFTIE